ncbi:otoferlin-like [Schistocerca gregaria]|uniref:otoferlin-like n=1 Tax=Schistocerca gregaria TaxID=7010 RepID=UPI00211EDE06|nr:otoferlin-like [Schistocerca gregaria]
MRRAQARTSTCRGSRSPEWNERLVFYDLLPPMWQRVRLQVRHEDAVLAAAHLDLATVSSPGHDGFLPTFGPAYLYLYGGDAAYRGRLLVSLRAVPDAEVSTGGTAVETLPALDEVTACVRRQEELWRLEEHSLFAVLLGADCIPRALAGKAVVLQFAMGDQAGGGLASIATQAPLESEVTESGAMSIPLRAAPSRDGDAYCRLRLGTRKPCAVLRRRWPRFHTRMALSNALASLAASLESGLSELEKGKSRPTAGGDADQISTLINVGAKLREDATRLMKTTDIWAAAYTPLDIYRAGKCKKLVDKLRNMAEVWQSGGPVLGFDVALSTGSLLLEELRDAIEDPQPALPDVVVRLVLATGGSVGYARLKARDLLYTEEPGLRGSMCGKVSTVILKVATNVTSGQDEWCAVRLVLWLGASRDAAACLRSLPPGCSPQQDGAHPLPATVTCSQQQTLLGLAHVYGGRFFPGDDESGLCDPFVRVTIAGGHTLQTEVQFGKLDPVWDQTLPFQDVAVCCSSGKFIKKHPPLVIVEVFDLDKSVVGQRREELVGRALTSTAVRLQGEPHRPPSLRWLPLHRAQLHAGDLLFSAEVLQVGTNEDVAVETWSTREGVVVPIPVEIRPRIITYKLEAVFWGVRRLRRVQLLPVSRPRVALQVAGRRLCSAVIPDTAANPNFPTPHMVFTLVRSSLPHRYTAATLRTQQKCPDAALGCRQELPEQEEYLPPLQVEVHDCRSFGREVLAGVHALHSLADFVVPPPPYLTDKQLAEIQQGLEKGRDVKEPPAIAVKREIRKTMTAVRHSHIEDVPATPVTYKEEKKKLWDFFRCRKTPLDDKEKLLQEIQEPKKDEPERSKKGRLGMGLAWRRKHAAPTIAEEEIEAPDWWTKYYASLPQAERDRKLSLAGHVEAEATEPVEKLELYPCELEKLSQFSALQDWLRCFSLHRGKRADSGRSPVVGHVKIATTVCIIISYSSSRLPYLIIRPQRSA